MSRLLGLDVFFKWIMRWISCKDLVIFEYEKLEGGWVGCQDGNVVWCGEIEFENGVGK